MSTRAYAAAWVRNARYPRTMCVRGYLSIAVDSIVLVSAPPSKPRPRRPRWTARSRCGCRGTSSATRPPRGTHRRSEPHDRVARTTHLVSGRESERTVVRRLVDPEHVAVERELRRPVRVVPLEEPAVSRRRSLVDGGHRLEPQQVVVHGQRVGVTVRRRVVRRRAGGDTHVATVEERIRDHPGVQVVVLEAVVVDERGVGTGDGPVAGTVTHVDGVAVVVDPQRSR